MNVYGIGGAAQGIALPQRDTAHRVESDRSAVGAARQPLAPGAASSLLTVAGPTLQAEAPAGTDPELWSVLSVEERAFFGRVGGMGPLTYSHMIHSGQPATAVMRGGRIDVRA